jgi:hypothetical protein
MEFILQAWRFFSSGLKKVFFSPEDTTRMGYKTTFGPVIGGFG